MKNIKKEVHCLLVGAEIFFLLVILSFHHEECSIVSLQIQKARYCKNFIQQAAVIRKKSTEKIHPCLKRKLLFSQFYRNKARFLLSSTRT